VAGHLEVAERAAALGVRLAFGDPLPVEVGHLLDQVEVIEQDRPVRAHGQRVLLTRDGDTRVGRCRLGLRAGHTDIYFGGWTRALMGPRPLWGCPGQVTCRRGCGPGTPAPPRCRRRAGR